MRIAVDLDGVCYEWESAARYMLREYRGYRDLTEKSESWDYIQRQVAPEDWRWLWSEGVDLGLFRYGHVVKGAIIALKQLHKRGHTLIVVTHRPSSAVQDTIDWLSYTRLPFADVHILTRQQPKTSIDADVLIDDKPENIIEWADTKRYAIQFVQPWNEELVPRKVRIYRAYGWSHAVNVVEDIRTIRKVA